MFARNRLLFTYRESRQACRLHHQQSQREAPWRIDGRRAGLDIGHQQRHLKRKLRMGLVMLTLLTLMIFEKLHALEGSSASEELMRELGLVVWLAVASVLVIDLLVSVLCVVYRLVN